MNVNQSKKIQENMQTNSNLANIHKKTVERSQSYHSSNVLSCNDGQANKVRKLLEPAINKEQKRSTSITDSGYGYPLKNGSKSFYDDKQSPIQNNISFKHSFMQSKKNSPNETKQNISTSFTNHRKDKEFHPLYQFDLDNSFLSIFNQSQFSSGAVGTTDSFSLKSKATKQNKKILTQKTEQNNQLPSKPTTSNSTRSPLKSIKIQATPTDPLNTSTFQFGQMKNLLEEQKEKSSLCEEKKFIISECMKDIDEDNFRKTIPYLQELLSRAVDTFDLRLFESVAEFMANLAFEMNEYDIATYMYNQCRKIYTYTQNHSKKAKILLQLSKLGRICGYHSEARVLLKKALQYAWFSSEKDVELEVYEETGRNYHFEGNIQKSWYYHKRFVNGEYEDDKSPTKIFSEDSLKTFFRTIEFKFQEVTSLLLAYLRLPLLTLDQLPDLRLKGPKQVSLRVSVNPDNIQSMERSQSKKILSSILKEDEFYILIQSPKFPIPELQSDFGQMAKKRLKKLIFRQQTVLYDKDKLGVTYYFFLVSNDLSLSSQQVQKVINNRDFNNPFKYKVSIQKKLEFMGKNLKDPMAEKQLQQGKQMRYKSEDAQINSKIFLNTVHKTFKRSLSKRPVTANYRNIYKSFIADYVEKNHTNPTSRERLFKNENIKFEQNSYIL